MDDRLRELLTQILPANRFYAAKFAGIDPARAKLADLPFTTKAELLHDQATNGTYGSNMTYGVEKYCRLHQTSGTTTGKPLRWLDTAESWNWMLGCWRSIFNGIKLQANDRLFFPFSYGPFLGFWTAFEAASQSGRFVLPGGGMSSSARLRFMLDHAATVAFCTPTYALHLAEVAETEKVDLASSAVHMLVVAGEPGGSIPATRSRIESAWGARVIDHHGLTETGPVAYEPLDRPGGLVVLENDYIAEVVDPAGEQATKFGEVGELVLTNLGRMGSPLIRYRTGDLVRADKNAHGSWWFARGILGRVDEMIHLRGNNVYPSAIEAIVRRFPEIVEFRLVVDRKESLASLRIEIECVPSAEGSVLVDRIGKVLRDELLFRAEVFSVPPGTLPRFEMKARRVVYKD